MGQTKRFQETLRSLAMIDEAFAEDKAGLGLDLARVSALDPKTAALLLLRVAVAIRRRRCAWNGAPAGRWRRGASEDEIADVLLAIAPVAGLARIVAAAPEVATALGYDVARRAGGTRRVTDNCGLGGREWR